MPRVGSGSWTYHRAVQVGTSPIAGIDAPQGCGPMRAVWPTVAYVVIWFVPRM